MKLPAAFARRAARVVRRGWAAFVPVATSSAPCVRACLAGTSSRAPLRLRQGFGERSDKRAGEANRIFDSEEEVNDSGLVSAVLGGEDVPAVMVSDLPSLYEEAMRTSIAGKSDRQKKKVPFTHEPRAESRFMRVPPSVRQAAGLGEQESFVIVQEGNVLLWPSMDVIPMRAREHGEVDVAGFRTGSSRVCLKDSISGGVRGGCGWLIARR